MSFYIGCGMVLVQGDRFVLVQESRGQARNGLYNLPAGTLEEHEDLVACVSREVQEETGASVEPEHFIGLYQTVLADGNNVLFFVFSGTVGEGFRFSSDEHHVIESLSYDEIVALEASGTLRSPIVLQAIKDYREGTRHPLDILRSYHVASLDAIVVDKT